MKRCVFLLLALTALTCAASTALAGIERVPRSAPPQQQSPPPYYPHPYLPPNHPKPSSAYTQPRPKGPGIVLRGGLSGYYMNDLNNFLDASNALAGTSFSRVEGGGSFGGGIRLLNARWIAFEVDYDRLTGATEDFYSKGKIKLDANMAMGTLTLYPFYGGGAYFGIGGGAGAIQSDAELRGANGQVVALGGWDPAYYAFGSLDVPVASWFAFTVDGGYRWALVQDVTSAGYLPPGTDLDWSGVVFRAGIALYAH